MFAPGTADPTGSRVARREGGRYVVVTSAASGKIKVLTPEGYNVRTRVHGYGGMLYVVGTDALYFSNFADQRLHDSEAARRPSR